jgi:hypothetical protein
MNTHEDDTAELGAAAEPETIAEEPSGGAADETEHVQRVARIWSPRSSGKSTLIS